MKPLRIFISSVQKEFAEERKALSAYLGQDVLMRRFYEPFLFGKNTHTPQHTPQTKMKWGFWILPT